MYSRFDRSKEIQALGAMRPCYMSRYSRLQIIGETAEIVPRGPDCSRFPRTYNSRNNASGIGQSSHWHRAPTAMRIAFCQHRSGKVQVWPSKVLGQHGYDSNLVGRMPHPVLLNKITIVKM